jgi:hypothetical protein
MDAKLSAAQEMVDEEHDTPPSNAYDNSIYICRGVGEYNIVDACLP